MRHTNAMEGVVSSGKHHWSCLTDKHREAAEHIVLRPRSGLAWLGVFTSRGSDAQGPKDAVCVLVVKFRVKRKVLLGVQRFCLTCLG